MSPRWQKVLRDCTGEGMRSLVVIVAIAIGVAGLTAVLASQAILTRELNRGYLATNPASFSLETDRVDPAAIRIATATPGVAVAEPRRVVQARIRIPGGPWRSLTLFIVHDYASIQVSTLKHERGAWPPATGELLIERDAFQVIGAKIGDEVIVKTSSGAEHSLHVSGSVHDVGQAQARMENAVYGYATLATLAQLGEEPRLDALNILVSGDRFDVRHIRTVAEALRGRMVAAGHPVRALTIPEPGKHPHAALMSMLLSIMAAFGLFVMILAGTLVTNLITALVGAQRRQIGIMKAIGATPFQIASLYLAEALIFGIGALVIGIPAGMAGGRALTRSLAIFLNFDITSFAVPLRVYASALAVGLAIPLVAAAIPAWGAGRTSVRAALAIGPSQTRFGATVLDRLFLSIGGPWRSLLLGLRNAVRRRTRIALTLGTLVVAGTFFMTALNLRTSLMRTLDGLFATRRFDLAAGLVSPQPSIDVQRALAADSRIKHAEGWLVVDAAPAAAQPPALEPAGHRAGDPEAIRVVALPPGSSLETFRIIAGRTLKEGDSDAAVVNSTLAAQRHLSLDQRLPLMIRGKRVSLRIVGIAREPLSPPVAYAPLAFFATGPLAGRVNSVRIALGRNDPASIELARAAIERELADHGIAVAAVSAKNDARVGFDQHMLMIYVFLVIMSAMLALVGGFGLMTAMTLNVLERRRELAVFRAIGATPARVASTLLCEGVAIAAAAWALAAMLSLPLSRISSDILSAALFRGNLDFAVNGSGVWLWLLLSLAVGGAACVVPALHASRASVCDALACEA